MKNNPLPRLDHDSQVRQSLLKHCRLAHGQIWVDSKAGHKVGCLDAADAEDINNLLADEKAQLAIHDPPYNLVAFQQRKLDEFIEWSKKWITNTIAHLDHNACVYLWLGADQNNGFQPLPDFMVMMRQFKELESRSFITMRNQRGYGTAKNWMAVRQELLYYVKGNPSFNVQYTDIPKVLRGYYKKVKGQMTENSQRSKSQCIRASNVWVDIQQVFYRMHENVTGCYAQKPLKSIDRIIQASSKEGDLVLDFFAHSGATLISAETLGRKCYTIDTDPLFCEIAIRRLERLRQTGETGWQNNHPFEELITQ